MHIILTVLSGIILAGLLSGCAIPTKEDIARSTTEFNLVAEKAGNEMLLLNIVRASKRRPMYFTSIGKLTRSMNFEYGTGGVSIPFGRIGGGLNGSYSIAPSAGYRNTPILDVSVLDTKEFTNGIMTPVPMKTIEYYWRQGWYPEILLHLFIRRIEIIDKEGKVLEEYVNYPGDPNSFADFQEQIRIKNWKWDIEEANATSIGEVGVNDTSQLKNLIEVHKAGLTLTPVKENNKVQEKGKDEEKNKIMKLCSSQANYVFTREATEDYKKAELDKIEQETMPPKEKMLLKKMLEKSRFDPTNSRSGNKDGELQIKVYLRSPEAMLYYLGEILRGEIRGENKVKPNPNLPIIHAGLKGCEGTEDWLCLCARGN